MYPLLVWVRDAAAVRIAPLLAEGEADGGDSVPRLSLEDGQVPSIGSTARPAGYLAGRFQEIMNPLNHK